MDREIKITEELKLGIRGIILTISIAFACYIAVNYGLAIDLFSMVVTDMKKEIGFDYSVVGTIAAFTRGGFLVASLLSVIIVPLIGAGRLTILSVVICTACFWGMAFANNVWLIGGLMTLIGACAATVYIPMVGLVGRFIPAKYHGRVMGFICGGQSLGVISASFMVPFFITHQTWRSAWIAVGIIAIVVVVVSFPILHKIGMFESEPIENRGLESESPFKGIGTILTRGTILVMVLYFLSAFACNPFLTYLSAYLRDELGLSVDMASTIWSCIAIPGIVSGFAMGYVADRLGIRFSLIVAYMSTSLASLILALHLHSALFIPAGFLFGLAYYSIFGLIPAYISKTNSPSMGVQVFAFANIIHGTGGASGNFLGGWFKETVGSFQLVYILIAIASLVLIMVSIFLPNENKLSMEGEAAHVC